MYWMSGCMSHTRALPSPQLDGLRPPKCRTLLPSNQPTPLFEYTWNMCQRKNGVAGRA